MLPAALVLIGAYMLFDYLRRGGRRPREVGFDNFPVAPPVGTAAPLGAGRFRRGEIASRRHADIYPPRR